MSISWLGDKITMKELPDDETLDKLLELAKVAEQKAKAVYDLATEIDEKLRIRQELRRHTTIRLRINSQANS